jgi:hypothetical protein
MAAKVTIALDAPADALAGYSAGAVMRLQSSATEGGVYANLTTIAIAATTFSYEYWDNAGDTTTWYRWRIENAGGTETGEYSDPFQGVDPAVDSHASGSYADVDDVLIAMRQNITDTRWLANLQKRLVETTRDLTRELGGYTFFRSGTETRRYHGKGRHRLHVHEGIVSASLVEIQPTTGGSWVELESDDWYLEGYPDQDFVADGEPYFHIVLEADATYTTFPTTRRGVRVTGVFGWPAVLPDARAANVAWARNKMAADTTVPGGALGPEELGSPVGADRWPRAVYDFIMAERGRHHACSL